MFRAILALLLLSFGSASTSYWSDPVEDLDLSSMLSVPLVSLKLTVDPNASPGNVDCSTLGATFSSIVTKKTIPEAIDCVRAFRIANPATKTTVRHKKKRKKSPLTTQRSCIFPSYLEN